MPDAFEFTRIRALTEEPALHRAAFRTEAGRQCWLKDEGPGSLDLKLARRAVADDLVVFVAFDPATGACRYVSHFSRDHVKALDPAATPKPGLRVTLVLRPAYLLLPEDHPRYGELRERLAAALAERRVVWVGTFPGGTEIKDVHVPVQP